MVSNLLRGSFSSLGYDFVLQFILLQFVVSALIRVNVLPFLPVFISVTFKNIKNRADLGCA